METHGEICKFSAGNTEARISLISKSKHSVQKLGHFRKLNSVLYGYLSIYLSNRDKLKFSGCEKSRFIEVEDDLKHR